MSHSRVHWGSRIGFVLAAAGSAVGLGNIWKFPYIVGKYGGGAFVCMYLLCVLFVGIPIFLAELYVGQKAQASVVRAFRSLGHPRWSWIGYLGVLTGFLVLSFYNVVGGWVLDFFSLSLTNHFGEKSDETIRKTLDGILADPKRVIFWHFVFSAATTAIVVGGVKAGIERWNKILMPSLVVLLLALVAQALMLPGFPDAARFLFQPDFSKLTAEALLEAVGHSFFTLSLGMGALITYGSYLDEKAKLPPTALAVTFMDTTIALMAGLVTLSAVFTFKMEPEAGPTLMFQTLPVLFMKLPGSYFTCVAFFLLVAFAALTSSISLLEVIVAYVEENWGMGRTKAAMLFGALTFFGGILSALSFNELSHVKIWGDSFFDFLNKITTSVMLPLGGVGVSLFYGWKLGRPAVEETLGGTRFEFAVVPLLWTTRVLAPIAILIVLVSGVAHWR